MFKKSFFCGLCIFFLISSLAIAQYKVELLTYYEQSRVGFPFFQLYPADPSVESEFNTGTFLTLHVPECKKCDAIVFDASAQGNFTESKITSRLDISCINGWRIISDVIPPNIQVFSGMGLGYVNGVQGGIQPLLPNARLLREAKILLERGRVGNWWHFTYKDTNDYIPDAEAIPILNKLLDNGFDVEFYFYGTVRGISWVWIHCFNVYISSIEKKK